MNMKKIINWLRSIELLAGNVYREASDRFATDQKYSAFLSRLSQDETWHFYILGDALKSIQDKEAFPEFGIKIDSFTKHEIETPFRDLYYLINERAITKKELIDCIVKAEFSEWNNIFLYALKLVGDLSTDFQHVAATIEAHKEKIKKFLEELPEEIKPPDDLFKLPSVWEKKILIIEEDSPFREFLSDLLMGMGEIEEVSNDQEGLERAKDNFFNVITLDVNMKTMSGLELYQKAVKVNPNISRNFLFYSDEITSESKAFFQNNHLSYLEKPIDIRRFKQIAQEIIDKAL